MALKILTVTSEAYPLAKSGGLGDAVSGMALALRRQGVDISLLMPAYAGVREKMTDLLEICQLHGLPGGPAQLVRGKCPDLDVPVYLLVNDELYNRRSLYVDEDGNEYQDNPVRFAALAHAATQIAAGQTPLTRPDVIHAHDWHAALVPMLVHQAGVKDVRTVLTIHNLAFQGVYDLGLTDALHIHSRYQGSDSLEFWGKMNFMKAGIRYADRISAVSRTYAREILTPEFGCGLEGVLQARRDALVATPNGIDDAVWSPANPAIREDRRFSAADISNKALCKQDLQRKFGLNVDPDATVMAMGSRLTTQKMADLAAEAIPLALAAHPTLQVAVIGQGDKRLEHAMAEAAKAFPGRFSVNIGFDEETAHMLHAGGDILLHGSRFEPFGLTPIYAMRYGTLPTGSNTGGMADTITDAGGTAGVSAMRGSTGFLFEGATVDAMVQAIHRAMTVRSHPGIWRAMQHNAMTADFSWANSVSVYMRVYRSLVPAAIFLEPTSELVAARAAARRSAAAAMDRKPDTRVNRPAVSRGNGRLVGSVAA